MKWFRDYENIIKSLAFVNAPDNIWNCDDTGLQDHFLSSRVVAEVGGPCFEITCLASLNAASGYGTTMIIFKGKWLKAEWLLGCPPNTVVKMSDNRWINSQLFLEWGRQFMLQSLSRGDPHPHVLLLDRHSSHKLFKSHKHYWRLEGPSPGRLGGERLDITLSLAVFSKVWSKAATPLNAMAGFRGSGIYPLNPAHIDAALFAPTETTEREHQGGPPSAPPIHHSPQRLLQAVVHPPHLRPEAHPMHGPLQQHHCQCPRMLFHLWHMRLRWRWQ